MIISNETEIITDKYLRINTSEELWTDGPLKAKNVNSYFLHKFENSGVHTKSVRRP